MSIIIIIIMAGHAVYGQNNFDQYEIYLDRPLPLQRGYHRLQAVQLTTSVSLSPQYGIVCDCYDLRWLSMVARCSQPRIFPLADVMS